MKYIIKPIIKEEDLSNVVNESLIDTKSLIDYIEGITLLSKEEVESLPIDKRGGGGFGWSWTRSPGTLSTTAILINRDGSISEENVEKQRSVNPVLKIKNLKSFGYDNYKWIDFLGSTWQVINEYNYLRRVQSGEVYYHAFNENVKDGNDFETSDIKKFIDNWLSTKLSKYSQKSSQFHKLMPIAKRLYDILEKHHIWIVSNPKELLDLEQLELVKKAYDDSYEVPTKLEFGDDYNEFIELSKKLGIQVPENVWYD